MPCHLILYFNELGASATFLCLGVKSIMGFPCIIIILCTFCASIGRGNSACVNNICHVDAEEDKGDLSKGTEDQILKEGEGSEDREVEDAMTHAADSIYQDLSARICAFR